MIAKVNVQITQYLIRQAFEEGYRAANPERGVSSANPEKGEWFDHWLNSVSRKMLVENGIISGMEDWR